MFASIRLVARRAAPALARPAAAAPVAAATRPVTHMFVRQFAAAGALTRDAVAARVVDVLKQFEKVDAAKVSPDAHFTNDLGLDSLDAVEVVMALEDEFG